MAIIQVPLEEPQHFILCSSFNYNVEELSSWATEIQRFATSTSIGLPTSNVDNLYNVKASRKMWLTSTATLFTLVPIFTCLNAQSNLAVVSPSKHRVMTFWTLPLSRHSRHINLSLSICGNISFKMSTLFGTTLRIWQLSISISVSVSESESWSLLIESESDTMMCNGCRLDVTIKGTFPKKE